jgi:hypothetical protein
MYCFPVLLSNLNLRRYTAAFFDQSKIPAGVEVTADLLGSQYTKAGADGLCLPSHRLALDSRDECLTSMSGLVTNI